jgi:hypothetical protein
MQQQFSLFPLWQHPIFFCGPDWRRFADAVLVVHNRAEEPMDMRVRRSLPDLEESMRSTREAVLARVDLRSANIDPTLREGFACINDGLHILKSPAYMSIDKMAIFLWDELNILPSSSSVNVLLPGLA